MNYVMAYMFNLGMQDDSWKCCCAVSSYVCASVCTESLWFHPHILQLLLILMFASVLVFRNSAGSHRVKFFKIFVCQKQPGDFKCLHFYTYIYTFTLKTQIVGWHWSPKLVFKELAYHLESINTSLSTAEFTYVKEMYLHYYMSKFTTSFR